VTRRSFLICLVLILAVGGALRTVWLRADPPTTSVGIVWHDEGAWVHSARNRARFGVWRADDWNPVFVAPVFTALEYAAFEAFGIGTWQARVVPAVSGICAVLGLMAGLAAVGGRRVAAFGGALLATNYVFVMWNRAALMESTMTLFIVLAWAAYAGAERRPLWGLAAGAAVVLAWFTKAAAAFFVAAIVIDAVAALVLAGSARWREPPAPGAPDPRGSRAAWLTLAGLAGAAVIVAVVFVVPYWSEYRFYNWQMSVTRKPSYGLDDLLMRASWLPIVQDVFSRMWLVVAGGLIAIGAVVARWRTAAAGERLLVLWVILGLVELTLHDSGSERRYVMFIPALVALAALLVAGGRPWVPASTATARLSTRLLVLPLLGLLGYLAVGSLLRLAWLDDVRAGEFSTVVRVSAGLAALGAVALVIRWRGVMRRLSAVRVAPALAAGLLAIALVWNLGEFNWWARQRSYDNYLASIEVGRLLPAGTLVQGKLANGLALENGIRPLFIGTGFGNYADRLVRDDVRYILTYIQPVLGYESGPDGRLIQDLLAHYPNRRIIASFEVEETPALDLAALIDKGPPGNSAWQNYDTIVIGEGRARD
jgi:4-amino-4-deoxy-L-arabinose transferase-like glycosyltransferase